MLEINDIVELPEGFFSLKKIKNNQHQKKDPSLLAKYKNRTYKTSSSREGSNMDFNLITCEDKICIMSTLQSYVLH